MKKNVLFLLGAALFALASCDNTSETHMFEMPYPAASIVYYYADQERDSLVIGSTDSWTITQENGDWMSFTPASYTIPAGYMAQRIVSLTFSANTTGEMRSTTLAVKADGDTYRKSFNQYPYLNIVRPAGNLASEGAVMPLFELTDSAHFVTDSVKFIIHAQSATISSNADWLVPQTTSFTRSSDTQRSILYTCILSLTPNTTSEERKGELTLTTSNGCSNTITVRQLPRKENP